MIAAINARALVATAFVTISCSPQQNTMLRCDYGGRLQDVYSLDTKAGSVRLMSVNPPRSGGSLEVTESGYRLMFPENQGAGAMQLKVEINRHTGLASRELGRLLELTGADKKQVQIDPVVDSGKCVAVSEKEKL